MFFFSFLCHVSSLIHHHHSHDQDLHLRETKNKARRSRVRRDFSTRSISRTSTYRSTPAGWLLVEVKASFGCAVQHVSRLYVDSAVMIFLRKERAGEESKQKISAKVDGGKSERSAKKKVKEEEEEDGSRVREVGKRGRDGGKCGSGRKNSALARRARRQDSSSSNPDQTQPGTRQPENSRQV